MKLLTIDIETQPNLAYTWGLFKQNIGLSQLVVPKEMISFAAKWHGRRSVMFWSTHHNGKAEMVKAAADLLDEADAVIHYNGKRFDVPHLQTEMKLLGYHPPTPFKQIDLLDTAKKQFAFASNKLDHVTEQLGLTGKLHHGGGFELWLACMAGEEKAWNTMRRYNKQDVVTTEELYDDLLPWIKTHPHVGLYNGVEDDTCPRCGGTDLERRGYAYTDASKFQQYRCRGCGGWVRGRKAVGRVQTARVVS